MPGGGSRRPVCEDASVHARGGEAGGGAELGVGGWGVVRGAWRKGRDHAAGGGGGTEGAWSSDSRERASGRLEVGPSVGGEEPGGQGASH